MYLVKLALRPWRLATFSQVFSSLAVGVLLLLIGFLFWMQQGLKSVLTRLHSEQVMTAYLNSSVVEGEEGKVILAIKNLLDDQKNAEVKFVGTQEFLKSLKKQYPDLAKELESLGEDRNQVVPRFISVSGMFPSSLSESIKRVNGVESVESSKDRYKYVIGILQTLRWVLRILIGGVSLSLLTGLIHLSKMNAYLHQEALSLLKFWGASRAVLVLPGMFSGLLVGILGGALAYGGWATVGLSLARHVRSLSSLLKTLPVSEPHAAVILILVGGAMGQLAGTLGAFMATRPVEPGGEVGI